MLAWPAVVGGLNDQLAVYDTTRVEMHWSFIGDDSNIHVRIWNTALAPRAGELHALWDTVLGTGRSGYVVTDRPIIKYNIAVRLTICVYFF